MSGVLFVLSRLARSASLLGGGSAPLPNLPPEDCAGEAGARKAELIA